MVCLCIDDILIEIDSSVCCMMMVCEVKVVDVAAV